MNNENGARQIAVAPQSAPAVPVQQVLDTIARLSADDRVDAAKVTALFDLQERMMRLQAKQQFSEALRRVHARMPRVPKNGRVDLGSGKGGYDFTKWEDIDAFMRPILFDEGFAYPTFSEDGSDQNGIRWSATWRAFGHEEKNYITLPPDSGAGRNGTQARGSTNSYAKRYLSEDFLAIVREGKDDDGRTSGAKFIAEEQAQELERLIGETDTDFARFMQHFELASLRNMPADNYVVARNMLLAKQRGKKS